MTKPIIKLSTVFALITLLILLISASSAQAQTVVTRFLPKYVEPNKPFKVMLKLEFGSIKPNGVIIVEKIPKGFKYNSSDPKGLFLESFNELRWGFYCDEVFNRTITYTLIAPSEAKKYKFEGFVKTVHGTFLIKGDKELIVRKNVTEKTTPEPKRCPGFSITLFLFALFAIILIQKRLTKNT